MARFGWQLSTISTMMDLPLAIIGRTDATEETVNHTNPRAFGRYKQARLRHDGDMCILPQKVDLPACRGR